MHIEVDKKNLSEVSAGAFLINFLDKVFHANIFKRNAFKHGCLANLRSSWQDLMISIAHQLVVAIGEV